MHENRAKIIIPIILYSILYSHHVFCQVFKTISSTPVKSIENNAQTYQIASVADDSLIIHNTSTEQTKIALLRKYKNMIYDSLYSTILATGPTHTKKHREEVLDLSTSTRLPVTEKDNNHSITRKLYLSLSEGFHVTSPFGYRYHPILHKNISHNGIDLRSHFEKIFSPLTAIVETISHDRRSGLYLKIRCGQLEMIFAHLSKVFVSEGQLVRVGDLLCQSGDSGMTTGPHLHLGVKFNGQYINPLSILMK